MIRLKAGLILVIAALWPSGVAAQETGNLCLPPAVPHVPYSDADLIAYADIVAQDFEQYFSEITAYFSCMDRTRQDVFRQAKEVSTLHQAFQARAAALGVREKLAIPAQPIGDSEP